MSTPKSLAGYSDALFEIAQAFEIPGVQELRIPLPSQSEAITMRQRFYAFRTILRAQHPSLYPRLQSVTVKVTSEGLVFQYISTADNPLLEIIREQVKQQARAIPSAARPAILPEPPSAAPEAASPEDSLAAFEATMERLGFGGGGPPGGPKA